MDYNIEQSKNEGEVYVRTKQTSQYIAALSVTLGAFCIGNVFSWSSPALPLLQNSTTSPLDQPITTDDEMWIGSLLAIGALAGAFPTGYAADKIGRKLTLIGLSIPFILSWLIIAFAKNVTALFAARIFAGFSIAGACVTVPLYIGEIAENSNRGTLGSYFQLLLTMGILFSYILGACVDYFWLAAISCVIPVVFFIVMFFLPETPSYLVSKNKYSSAKKSLQWLRDGCFDVDLELVKIKADVEEAKRQKGTVSDLVSSWANIRAVIIISGLFFFLQMSGVNIVIFYAARIFTLAGSDLEPSICAIIVGVFQVVFTYISSLLVDRAGRKILLLISSGIMSVCLFILGMYFQMKENDEASVQNIGWLPLLSLNVFIVCFSLGFGPLPWLMMGELFSNSIKGIASGLSVTLNWVFVFIVTKTFEDLISILTTAGVFYMFGVITAVGFLFVLFVVIETKGKSFGEIQKMLGG